MRTISAEDLKKDWSAIADEVGRAPVRVHRDTGPDVVIVSEAEYLQFRRYAGERLQDAMNRIGAKAQLRGMTEEKLNALLADES